MATGGFDNTPGKSVDQSRQEKKSQVNEMNIVLVGRTGSGKSALANSILEKNDFESFHSPVSVTCISDVGETTRNGYKVKVVDTPGLNHTSMKSEEVKRCILETVDLSSPRPHAILYVGRVGRYSDEEHQAMQDFIKILGEEVLKYTIFVLTYGDLLQQGSAENYVDRLPHFFKIFIQRCGDRQIMFKSLSSNVDNEKQNAELISMIEMMRRTNKPPYFIRREKTFTLIVNRMKNIAFRLAPLKTKRNILRICMTLVAIYAFSYIF